MEHLAHVLASASVSPSGGAMSSDGLATWLIVLAALAILPFILTMITSFAKIVIVLGIVRQALGTQQIPPTTVITGLALILTVHVMWPVAEVGWAEYERLVEEKAPGDNLEDQIGVILDASVGPMADFLERHSHPDNIELFEAMRSHLEEESRALQPTVAEEELDPSGDDALTDDEAQADEKNGLDEIVDPATAQRTIRAATVLAPAFILTEITEAFQIGFLIFIPFLVVDLVVSNILLAMGMHMMSPTTVSLPLKLLLFVLVDGWQLILQGLVMGYAIGGYT